MGKLQSKHGKKAANASEIKKKKTPVDGTIVCFRCFTHALMFASSAFLFLAKPKRVSAEKIQKVRTDLH